MAETLMTCQQCGVDIGRRDLRATFCFPCYQLRTRRRICTDARVRNAYLTPLRTDTGFACMDCGLDITPDRNVARKRPRPRLRCTPCAHARRLFLHVLSGSALAGAAVARARATGVLPPASDSKCVDCERRAECYDHRDYGQPLKVEPVCRSCNVMRGHAKPIDQRIVSFVLAHAHAFIERAAANDESGADPSPAAAVGGT